VSSPAGHVIPGDRGRSVVARARSIGARIHQGFALAVVGLVGGGFLIWYYTALSAREAEGQAAVERITQQKTSAEMKLPPLVKPEPRAALFQDNRPLPEEGEAAPESFDDWNLGSVEDSATYAVPASYGTAVPTEDPAVRRTLDAPVLVRPSTDIALAGVESTSGVAESVGTATGGALAGSLVPTATPATVAEVVPTRRWLLPKGSFIDCTLETAIDSTLPGMTSCVTAVDIFGSDGRVVLLERGTKLIGETRLEVRTGQRRVFVLWHEARTPTGVVANLASPGTDALGRSGVTGQVDTHFSERFGAALLLSVIDSAAIALANSQQSSDATVIVTPQGSQDVIAEVVRQSADIPPTIRVAQGSRVQVFVARNIDFRSVYSLRARER
jgi:type IV secretion system protein VirB10